MMKTKSKHTLINFLLIGAFLLPTTGGVFLPGTDMARYEVIIYRLGLEIRNAGITYKVNASLVGAILADEVLRRDIWDDFQDIHARHIIENSHWNISLEIAVLEFVTGESIGERSIGWSQMNPNTLQTLIEEEYVDAPEGWESEQLDRSLEMLLDEAMVPYLIAARLLQTIDHWQAGGVDISNRPEILGTLYSIGLTGKLGVHPDPKPNQIGRKIANSMVQVSQLLYAQ